MSWDSYLDNLVAQADGHADRAAIIGLDGGASWTTAGHPNGIALQDGEGAKIAECFKRKDFSKFQASGVFLEGEKYQFLREEDGKLVMAKKKDKGSMTLQSSKTAIVIGHCPEGGQQGSLNKAVAVIAEYLESVNM
ncbi:profilin-like [Dreissena polymorpha]|uniref:Profilin n=1 Tax=Dreissena polymorpha TaxID=45954 RepID=A0A9D4I3M4_DREPO|nr:profilin-like [Dreissena polymorpha]KAH3741326.1 hypothetical protein DPMN_048050 [Dreissena polymorpha]